MSMERIEINVTTGKRTVVPYTQKEIEAVQLRAAEEAAKPRIKTFEERISACEAALGIRK